MYLAAASGSGVDVGLGVAVGGSGNATENEIGVGDGVEVGDGIVVGVGLGVGAKTSGVGDWSAVSSRSELAVGVSSLHAATNTSATNAMTMMAIPMSLGHILLGIAPIIRALW